jgi:putative pyruvate formate lyase activating enzyme
VSAEPSYLALHRQGVLPVRAAAAQQLFDQCELCPRRCGAHRAAGVLGVCRIGQHARVASFHAHFGEEAPLVGTGGSGTIFFSGCNLRCSFCQNDEISHGLEGEELSARELAVVMLRLQERGCHNINFVTPTHVVPQILAALPTAATQGLHIPLVYNCGGYESVATLRLLADVVDIYMPDFKFWDDRWAHHCCGVTDYRRHAAAALKEMHRQVGDLVLDEAGLAVRGLLVRHLVMPCGAAGTAAVASFLAEEISRDTYVNIMAQWRPCGPARCDPLLNRPLERGEYLQAVDSALRAGLHRLD